MDEKAAHTDGMPESIGRYKVLEGIGYGAMGAVYKAFDPLIKRTLAIKTIRLDIPRQSPQYRSFIDRFYHEARISGTLSHSNIVTLFDIGEENGIPYLAMEFVDGQTVAALVESGHRFKPEKVISLASQIASAIDYAHGKGVIHRDIKPSNLILHEDDRVKVTDFGIAKLADAEMTQSGTLLGTPSYMSPEQAMGDKLDGRSDIFSLGVCCFEMLSGEQPFPGTNVTSILYKLVHVDPIEPANLEMHGLVPQKWHEVFGRVLAKRPDDRYQTATAFVQDLEYCLGAWFGGLGTEETLATGQEILTPTVSMHVPPEDDPATVAMHASPAGRDDSPATVAMKAAPPPPAAADDPVTVVMKVPPAPVKPAPLEPATVVMKAPPPPPAPAAEPATVVMKPKPRPATPAAKPPAPAEGEPTSRGPLPPTVRMATPMPEETITLRVSPSPAALAPKTEPALPLQPQKSGPRPQPPPPPAPAVTTEQSPMATMPPVPIAPVARAGVPAGVVIGGGALALLFGLGVAVLLLRSGSTDGTAATPPPTILATGPAPTPTTTPLPPVPLPSGVLSVESTPPGAIVTVNGQSRGVTPFEMPGLAAGEYEVRVELRGYEGKTQTVILSEAEPRAEVRPVLTRAAPATGTADILSTPFGATVSVDGASAGQTPLLQLKLKPGTRKIEVAKDGYESWAGTLTVEAGKKTRVDAALRAIVNATPVPAPTAEAVDPSRIYNNLGSEVDVVAKKIAGSSTSYPDAMPKLRSGDSASVTISFVVTEEGEVAEPRILESGGGKLDEAVITAVRSWKYSPAAKRGVKVKVRITLKQTFRAG